MLPSGDPPQLVKVKHVHVYDQEVAVGQQTQQFSVLGDYTLMKTQLWIPFLLTDHSSKCYTLDL